MDDEFSTENRKSAWWATDSRRAVSGHLVDVILEKTKGKERADLSDIEAVQMGIIMQPTIGKIFQEQTGLAVRDLDLAGTCPTEPWLKAHGDFELENGELLEVKNFHASQINKYPDMDDSGLRLPEPDLVQCVHEAVVFNRSVVYFAVLFGGQAFRYWKIDVTDEMKLEFIKRAAVWWAYCQTNTFPPAETPDQARAIFQKDDGSIIMANAMIEEVINATKAVKEQIKHLEEREARGLTILQNFMGDKAEIQSVAGETLVTWKSAKASMKFDPKLLKSGMPDLYEKFTVETKGSRRLLIK